MRTQKLDNLNALFERHLPEHLVGDTSQDQFVDKVVDGYIAHITATPPNFILDNHFLEIKEDLTAEVTDMLRKKTYGQIGPISHSEGFEPKDTSEASDVSRKPT